MVAKIKEFTPKGWLLIRQGQIALSYKHLAGYPEKVDTLQKSGCIAFASEGRYRFGLLIVRQ